jgi:long-subunit fatty acid transport protein
MDPTTGRAVFTGATMPSATSIELNPAALAIGITDESYVSATAVADQLSIATRTEDLATGALANGPSVSATTFSPGFMAAHVWHFKDRASVGASFRSTPVDALPSGLAPLQYHTLGLRERTWTESVGASARLTDELYIGFSATNVTRELHLRYAWDTALANGPGRGGINSDCGNGMPCGIGNPAATQIFDIDVHSKPISLDTLEFNVGAVYQFGKDTFLGASYHTVPGVNLIQQTLTGNAIVTQAPREGGGLVHGGASVNIQEAVSADAELRTRVAHELDLHVGVRWEDLSRFAAYDVRTYGTALASIGVPEWTQRPRGFHDPVAVWAGVEQAESAKEVWLLRLGGRLGFETSAVPDARTSPGAIAPLSFISDVGAEAHLGPWILQLSYGLQYFPTVHVEDSAYDPRDRLDCIANGTNYATPACESTRRGYAIATAAGDYSRFEHSLRISLRVPWSL